MKKLKGFGLIELMLSLTMVICISSYLVEIYLSSEKSNEYLASLHSLQENTQVSIALLKESLHAAGFIGCAHFSSRFPLVNHSFVDFKPNKKIEKNPDSSFTVRFASFLGGALQKPMRGYETLYVDDRVNFSQNNILLVSDCRSADVFVVKSSESFNDHIQKITATFPLSTLYGNDAVVRKLEENTYFVGDTTRKTPEGDSIHALFVKNIQGKKSELVEGVEDMQIKLDVYQKSVRDVSIKLTVKEGVLQKIGLMYAAISH